jgi:hypothetical protein
MVGCFKDDSGQELCAHLRLPCFASASHAMVDLMRSHCLILGHHAAAQELPHLGSTWLHTGVLQACRADCRVPCCLWEAGGDLSVTVDAYGRDRNGSGLRVVPYCPATASLSVCWLQDNPLQCRTCSAAPTMHMLWCTCHCPYLLRLAADPKQRPRSEALACQAYSVYCDSIPTLFNALTKAACVAVPPPCHMPPSTMALAACLIVWTLVYVCFFAIARTPTLDLSFCTARSSRATWL